MPEKGERFDVCFMNNKGSSYLDYDDSLMHQIHIIVDEKAEIEHIEAV